MLKYSHTAISMWHTYIHTYIHCKYKMENRIEMLLLSAKYY